MPIKTNDFEREQKKFVKNLKTINLSLSDFSNEIQKTTKEYAISKKKIGAFDINALEKYSRPRSKIKTTPPIAMDKKLTSSLNNLDSSINKLDKDTIHLKDSFTDSSLQMTDSMEELSSITEKNTSKMRYVADGLKSMGKTSIRGIKHVAAAPVKAGMHLAEQPAQVASETIGDVRGEMTTSFKKALGMGIMGTAGGVAPGMMATSLFDVFGGGSKVKDTAKAGLSKMGEGISAIANWVKGFPKKTREKGIFQVAPDSKKQFHVAPDEEFSKGFESISEKVVATNEILDVEEGHGPLEVAPTKEFKEALSPKEFDDKEQRKLMANAISDAFQKTGKGGMFKSMIGDMFGLNATIGYALPIFGAGYKAELPQPGKYGLFGAMLKTLGLLHVDSRFASHEINKLMMQQSKLLQIGFEIPGTLWRPRARSLSEWLGGTIASSFSETVGGTEGPFAYLKDALTGKIKGITGGITSFLGLDKDKKGGGLFEKLIPGYKEWGEKRKAQKEVEELRKSPSIATRIQLMVETKSILEEHLPQINTGIEHITELLKTGKLKTAKIKTAEIPKLAEALEEPKEIVEGGLVEVDKGETVGKIAKIKGVVKEKASKVSEYIKEKKEKIQGTISDKKEEADNAPKGGIFSRMLGGVANFFTGGIFKRIGKWFTDLKDAVVNIAGDVATRLKKVWDESIISTKLTEFVDWFKVKFEYLAPIPGFIKDIKSSFIFGKKFSKEEQLKGDKTRTTIKERQGTSIFGGIDNVIKELSQSVKKMITDFGTNISEMLNKEIGEDAPRSISNIIATAYQKFIPEAFTTITSKMYKKFTDLITEATKTIDLLMNPIRILADTFSTFGKKVIKPMKDAWEGEEGSIFKKSLESIKAIPKSIVEAFKGTPELIKGIGKSLMSLGSAIVKAFMNLTGIGFQITYEFGLLMVDLRKELAEKILPESWHKIYSKIEDWVLEVKLMSINVFMKALGGISTAWTVFMESIDKEHGLLGIVKSGFFGMFKAAKEGLKVTLEPLTNLIKDIYSGLLQFKEGLIEYHKDGGFFKNIKKDFGVLWENIKKSSSSLSKVIQEFTSFVSKTKEEDITFIGIVKQIKDGLFNTTNNIFQTVLKSSVGIFDYIAEKVKGIGDFIYDKLKEVFKYISEKTQDVPILGSVTKGLNFVIGGILSIQKKQYDFIIKVIKGTVDWLSKKLSGTFEFIINLSKSTSEFIIDKSKTVFDYIFDKAKNAFEFIGEKFRKGQTEELTPMAKGGLIYAAKGVVVGEAGPEAVLPLEDEIATEKVAGMLSRALIKLGLKKDKEGENLIVQKLDELINVFKGDERQSVFGKMLGGIVDINIGLIKLPLSLGSGMAKGIGQGLGQLFGAPMTVAVTVLKTIAAAAEISAEVAKTTLSAIRTGFTGIRHAINFGVASIKTALAFGWKMITAPFKAVGRFIMKPFQSIKEKITGVKEKVKEKVKGALGFMKRKVTGDDVVGADPEGKPVTAKWPGKIIHYLGGIYKILKADSKINVERVAHESKMEYMTRKIKGGIGTVTGWLRKFWKQWILKGMLAVFGGLKSAFMFIGSQIVTSITTLGSVLAAKFGLGGLLGKLGSMGLGGAAAGVAGLGMAAYGAYKGVKKAGEWHGIEPGEKVKTSQKITAGIGGALGGSGEGGLKDAAVGAGKGALLGASIGSFVPVLGTALGAGIGAIAGGILGAIGGKNIAKALQYVLDKAKKTIKAIVGFIMWPYKMIWKGVKKAKDWIMDKIPSFDSIKEKLQSVIDLIMWPFKKIKELLVAAKDWIAEKIKGIPFIGGLLEKKLNKEAALETKTEATEKVKGLFTPKAYEMLEGDVANRKRLMDIGAIVQGPKNELGQKYYTKEEGSMIKTDENIPKMAKGGIVTTPTKVLIGEAGPEAVVPLTGGLEQNPEVFDAIKKQIIFHEGVRLSKYLDTMGKETIGIGHLIQSGEKFPDKISKEEAYSLFDKDFVDHYQGIKNRLDVFGSTDAVRQGALLDMAFNLGVSGVKKFKNALTYLKDGNFEDAYKEILYKSKDSDEQSLYAQQLPNRSKTIGGLILTGDESNIVTHPPVVKAHKGAMFMGDEEFPTVVKGGEMVVTPDEPKFGRVITDAFMNIISKGLEDKGPKYKEVEGKAMATSTNIAEHEARMEVGKQRIIADELSQNNKNLKGSIDKLATATVINSTVSNTTANNSTTTSSNVVSNAGSSGFDADTEKILGGRL